MTTSINVTGQQTLEYHVVALAGRWHYRELPDKGELNDAA